MKNTRLHRLTTLISNVISPELKYRHSLNRSKALETNIKMATVKETRRSNVETETSIEKKIASTDATVIIKMAPAANTFLVSETRLVNSVESS